VKFLRRLRACLIVLLVVVAILVTPAFIPAVQTWAAQSYLARQTEVHGTLGTLWAGFSFINVSNARLETQGAVLTLPSLDAHLPLLAAYRRRRFAIRSLEAKGWTLDLSKVARPAEAAGPPSAPPAGAPAPLFQRQAEAAQKVVGAVAAALHTWRLPWDASFDGIDLEGDVILASPPGKDPVEAHLAIDGGGLSPGHDGVFHIEAELHDPELPVSPISLQGTLTLTMDSPRTLSRIELKTELASAEASRAPEPPLSVDVAVSREADGDALAVDLSRPGRQVASVHMRLGAASPRYAGTWTADVRDSELAPLVPDHPLPSLAISGSGTFDAEDAFARVRAAGRLNVAAAHLGVLEPRLDQLGAITLEGRFGLARDGDVVRVTRLDVSAAGTGPVGAFKTLQPFDVNLRTRAVTPSDPGADWIDLTVQRMPIAWFSYLTDRVTLTGGDASGAFLLRSGDRGIALRTKTPLAAAGLTVLGAGRVLGQGLDLSVPLVADWSPKGWTLQAAPLVLSRGGQAVVTLAAKAQAPAAADQPVAVTATWSVDLDALAANRPASAPRWIAGRSASGDFSAKVGSSIALDAKLSLLGHDPGRTVTANLHADIDDEGGVAFDGPIKIGSGADASDVSVKGTWNGDVLGGGIDLTLTGDTVDWDHLRLLGGPLASVTGIQLPSAAAPAPGARDTIPFWGNWTGHVDATFGKLKAGGAEFNGAGGALYLRSGFIQLVGGHWMLPHTNVAKVDGTLSFDPRSDTPYSVKGTADLNQVDAAPLYPGSGEDKEPGLEGHFSLAGTVRGSGATVGDLLNHTEAEFRLTSTSGILRLLATSVAEAIPEASTPVTDTLNSVGSAVGALLGTKRGALEQGKNPVSKTADDVISFTYEINEIGFDKIDITAVRGSDGAIRLTRFELVAPDEHLTGTGQIAFARDTPLKARPLSADLVFAFKGHPAELLGKAGLLSGRKDTAGYALLNQPVHLAGTVEHIDTSAWHDLLARAATGKPAGGK
jgi:hypothetical protein